MQIMHPINLFQDRATLTLADSDILLQKHRESFIAQLNKDTLEKTKANIKDVILLVTESLLETVSKDTFLTLLAAKLVDCKKLVEEYLIITDAIGHHDDKTEIAACFDKTIPIIIKTIHEISLIEQTERAKVQTLIEGFHELEDIMRKQNIELITSNVNIDELLATIEEVGKESNIDSRVLEKVKTSVKHVFYHEDPQQLALNFVNSVSELMSEVKLILDNDNLTNARKVEFIKAFINESSSLRVDTKYILQLGCELLNLGDPQGAIKVFNEKKKNIDPDLEVKLSFDEALALVEIGNNDNYSKAEAILQRLLLDSQSANILSRDKILALLTITFDKQGEYQKAANYCKQISKTYETEVIFEKLLLLKYEYNFSPRDAESRALAFIENEKVIENFFKENQDTDFYYLVGVRYALQNDVSKANEYFNQVMASTDLDKSLLITENSHALFQILYTGVIGKNDKLVSTAIAKYSNSQNMQKEVLFAFVRAGDIDSVEFLISQGTDINITDTSRVTALDIACECNDFNMVNFLLTQGIRFDTISMAGIKPLQAAAMRIAHEDGDIRVVKELLQKYKSTHTVLDKDILLDIDYRLQDGPNYIDMEYRNFVKDSLGEEVDWPQIGSLAFEW